MQIEFNWLSLIALVLGPSLLSGLFIYLTARLQLCIKDKEIKGRIQLQARMLLFKSYEKELEQLIKDAESRDKSIGKMLHLLVGPDLNNKDQILESLFRLFMLNKKHLLYQVNEIEVELKKTDLLTDERKEQISSLRQILSSEQENLNEEEMERQLAELTSIQSLTVQIKYELLEKKRDELFSGIL